MRRFSVVLLLACTASVLAQHEHHPSTSAMKISPQARLEVQNDAVAESLTVRVGPLDLPAKSDHTAVAQAPTFFLEIPFDGWITAYHPRLVQGSGAPVPSRLLHHVAFYNTARPDFLCPNKQEHIFGAGGEMNDWPALPGFGYRVHKGDRIRISTMFHNPTGTSYPKSWLEVKLDYRSAAQGESPKSMYPAWFDVGECGESSYDLDPGRSLKMGQFQMGFSGWLLGVGGHMHDFGRQLDLFNVTRGEDVAPLKAQLDAVGHIESMPIVRFTDRGGYKLNKGDVLRVSSIYENPRGKPIPDGAMGIVVGYFLPEHDAEVAGLKKQ
jgi:hypothetical protein